MRFRYPALRPRVRRPSDPVGRSGAQKRKDRGRRAAKTASGHPVRGRRGGLAEYQR